MASAVMFRAPFRALGSRIGSWLQRYWLVVVFPPVVFLLAAGVTRQAFRAWDGYYYAEWRKDFEAYRKAGAQGDRVQALEKLNEAARHAPDDSAVHHELSKAYQALGRTDLAAESLERAMRLKGPQGGNYEVMWTGLLHYYCEIKHYDQAERVLRADVLPRWPDSAKAHLYEGEIYLSRGGGSQALDLALRSLKKSLSLDPKNLEAQYQYGICLARLGKLSEAERVFKDVLNADPDRSQAYNDLAGVLRQQGKRDEAQRAMATFKRIQDRQARINHLRTQVSFHKIKPGNLLELGELYLAAKQPSSAEPILVQYTKKEPTDPRGHRSLGEAYRRLERGEDARAVDKLADALEARRGATK
jgi:tetratricopeptide (TPR) repeat protein